MKNLSRFHKERALREHGRVVPAYPKAAPEVEDTAEQITLDRTFLSACLDWEEAVDREYLKLLQTLPPAAPSAEAQQIVEQCARAGLAAGLSWLNKRVEHRYTALYKLDGGTLQNIELVDKLSEVRPDFLAAVPLNDSFCQFVFRNGAFKTSDAAQERELDGHPYQNVMLSYHGVPVLDESGELFGSLCHFDVVTRPFTDDEFDLLQGVARSLAPHLRPYQ